MDKHCARKIKSNMGFTLVEMLAAIVVLVMITAVLAVALPSSVGVYKDLNETSEGGVLGATLSQIVMDELRYAEDVKTDGSGVLQSYTSAKYGAGVNLANQNGKIYIQRVDGSKQYGLVGDKSYTSNLAATTFVTYANKIFDVSISVLNTENKKKTELNFQIKPVNM